MTPENYAFLCELLAQRSGLVLSDNKQYLVESRLAAVARRNGLGSIDELIKAVRNPGSEPIRAQITEAMTTNETFFFRDKVPFEQFADYIVPEKLKARSNRRQLRIWCAAASTGQEPYSLAMQLNEMHDKVAGWKIQILATDLSGEVLEKARAGMYTQFEVQRGLPINLLVKYFKQVGDMWQLAPAIRSMVEFRPFNLLDDMKPLGVFDVIFCRNVLIYFDKTRKTEVLDRLNAVLAPDGVLVLGAAETIIGLTERLRPIDGRRGLFQPAGNPVALATGKDSRDAAPCKPAPVVAGPGRSARSA